MYCPQKIISNSNTHITHCFCETWWDAASVLTGGQVEVGGKPWGSRQIKQAGKKNEDLQIECQPTSLGRLIVRYKCSQTKKIFAVITIFCTWNMWHSTYFIYYIHTLKLCYIGQAFYLKKNLLDLCHASRVGASLLGGFRSVPRDKTI
jgi:hypothetical protein